MTCRKIRYRTSLNAMIVLARTGRSRHTRRPKDEIRAYYCPPCRGWHLTSQPKRSN